ncbi:oligosaccharide flippase family protein [Paenibacillus sp. GCM10012307]|uniref:Oligosaccharide flippase family protein n=1 Tax=Paenibacillus roseus TaxID=2798579 RepID=A0A934MKP2_9BACL|nr:oligosaccharide flippase family protein [Paenibacillus roseus]MBJ6361270.1 oligosaccharide flippase family protein [Paenibacillus roseus]
MFLYMSVVKDTQISAASSAEASSRKDHWLHGAVLLGGAALFSKVLGTFQKIPLQNLAGDRVFGIYNAVYPLYQLLLYLSSAGIPVAVSLLIAKYHEAGDRAAMRGVLRAGLLLLMAGGLLGFGVMWLIADLAASWLGDPDTAWAIRMASLGLWLVPAVGALRGYYQGQQQILPSALSQVIEQTFRVAAMLSLLLAGLAAGWPASHIAAGTMAGTIAGGAAGLAVLLLFWLRDPALRIRPHYAGHDAEAKSWRGLLSSMRNLARLALPVAFGSLAVPVAGIVDAITVPRLLAASGLGGTDLMTMFGLYSRGQPLVQLVVMVAGGAAGALVPILAVARARGDLADMSVRTELAMRFTWWFGTAATVGLVWLAEPINILLYSDNQSTWTFIWVCCTALAGSLNAVTAALLQGMGSVRLPALLLLVAALLKGLLNAVLVPAYGIEGAAYAGVIALTAAALPGVIVAVRTAGVRLPARPYAAGTAFALACMLAALWLLERLHGGLLDVLPLPGRGAAAVLALTGVAVGAMVFAAALVASGGLSARELRALPGGSKLAGLLERLRLLKRA